MLRSTHLETVLGREHLPRVSCLLSVSGLGWEWLAASANFYSLPASHQPMSGEAGETAGLITPEIEVSCIGGKTANPMTGSGHSPRTQGG